MIPVRTPRNNLPLPIRSGFTPSIIPHLHGTQLFQVLLHTLCASPKKGYFSASLSGSALAESSFASVRDWLGHAASFSLRDSVQKSRNGNTLIARFVIVASVLRRRTGSWNSHGKDIKHRALVPLTSTQSQYNPTHPPNKKTIHCFKNSESRFMAGQSNQS